MDGIFGGFTRWAVVFLIIFVLFFLLIPVGVGPVAGACGYGGAGFGYGGAGVTPFGGYGGGIY